MQAVAQLITLLAISCLSTSCLRGGFAPAVGEGSAGDAGQVPVGDGAPDVSCSPAWRCAFTLEPRAAVTELNTAERECDPVLSADCLTITFGSYRAGGQGSGDLWTASRASSTLPFGAPTNYAAFNTPSTEQRLIFTRDGLQAFLTSDRGGGQGLSDIWSATRASTTAAFGPFINVSALNTARNEYDVFPSADGLRLYFVIEDNSSHEDIWLAERSSPAAFSAPGVRLSGLNSAADDGAPTLSADELFIVFSSGRPGSAGTSDLWYAKRASRTEPFGSPQRLPVVNTSDGEYEPFLACGDRELWFVVERPGLPTDWDIYRSRFIAP